MLEESAVVVDIECFRYRNKEWIIKEIAICGDYLDSITVKPPHALDLLSPDVCKAYTWITKNLHGMHWNSGDYPFNRLALFVESVKLRYPNSKFYAKGFQKCVYLKELFHREFIDLDDLNCPKITNLFFSKVKCNKLSVFHSQTHQCARRKAKCYKDWLDKYFVENGMHESELVKDFDNITFDD